MWTFSVQFGNYFSSSPSPHFLISSIFPFFYLVAFTSSLTSLFSPSSFTVSFLCSFLSWPAELWACHRTDVWGKVQNMELITVQFSPPFCYSPLTLRCKYSPRHGALETSHPIGFWIYGCFTPRCNTPHLLLGAARDRDQSCDWKHEEPAQSISDSDVTQRGLRALRGALLAMYKGCMRLQYHRLFTVYRPTFNTKRSDEHVI